MQLPVLVKGKKVNQKKRKETIFLFCMLALPVLQWLVFWLYVNFSSILLAFQHQRTGEFTMGNFKAFWESLTATSGEIKIASKNTIIYFLTSLIITMPGGLLLSYFLYKRILGHNAFRIIFYFPAMISAVAYVAGFTSFIDPKGPLGSIVKLFGGQIPPEGLLGRNSSATPTIVVYNIWTGFSANLLIFGGAMSRIPAEINESAKLEGCRPLREFASIVMPLVWPTVSTAIIFAFTGIFNSSGPILLFTTDGSFKTTTISFWIFQQIYGAGKFGGSGSYNLVSAAGLCFTLVGVPVIMSVRWLMDRIPAVEY